MKKYRLAKGADGKERPWNKGERFHLFMRGWKDGAGGHVIRPDHTDIQEYERGYQTGYGARAFAAEAAAKRLRYKQSILRLSKGKNDGTRQRQR